MITTGNRFLYLAVDNQKSDSSTPELIALLHYFRLVSQRINQRFLEDLHFELAGVGRTLCQGRFLLPRWTDREIFESCCRNNHRCLPEFRRLRLSSIASLQPDCPLCSS